MAGLIIVQSGCRQNSGGASATAGGAQGDEVSPEMLLDSAIKIVQTAKFDRTSLERYQVVSQRLNQYLDQTRRGDEPLIQPMAIGLRQILARKMRPEMLQQIDADRFDIADMLHLETCYLMRDLASRLTADTRGDLAAALAIFDWVARNVQLIADEKLPRYRVVPRVSLILGLGGAEERAWVFMELLRQAGIESVVLGHVEPKPGVGGSGYVTWAPAALVEGELYVFDAVLGLPVPGPGGRAVATLAELKTDPKLLAALDLVAEHPYRFRPEHLDQLLVLHESSPPYNAPRMKYLQALLSGPNRVVLWSDLRELDGRVRAAIGGDAVFDLWQVPAAVHHQWQTERPYVDQINQMFSAYSVSLVGPTLLDARLAQLRGNLDEAISIYLKNRSPLPQFLSADENTAGLHGQIRENSTYFLGLTKYDQGEFATAADWFGKSLERYAGGQWQSSARYNLGRCAEALNDAKTAIESYTAADDSPQAAGNLLRARRLGWSGESKPPPARESLETPSTSTSDAR